MRRCCLWFLLVAFIFPSFASATEVKDMSLERVVGAVESPFKVSSGSLPLIADFRVRFVQESKVVSLGQMQRALGEAVFKFLPVTEKNRISPLFHWQYSEPEEQLIVSDGRVIWFYLPENQQAIRSEARKALDAEEGSNPLILLTNLGELSRFFSVRWHHGKEPSNGDYVVDLIPLKKDPLIKSVILGVRKEAVNGDGNKPVFPIRYLLLTNINNDETRIEFLDADINRRPSEVIFQFSPPQGTEILTPEEMQQAF